MWGLKQQNFILSQSWRPKVQNQGVGRSTFPPKTLYRGSFLIFLASGGSWHSLSCSNITPICLPHHMAVYLPHVSMCPLWSWTRTLSLDLGPTLIQHDTIVVLKFHLQRPHFQAQSCPEILEEHEFWGDTMVKKHGAGSAENTICSRASQLFEPQNLGLSAEYSAQLSAYNLALHSVEQSSWQWLTLPGVPDNPPGGSHHTWVPLITNIHVFTSCDQGALK